MQKADLLATPLPVKIQHFTDLNAWRKAHELVLAIYKVTKTFPADERFSLVSQMRRSVTSTTANLAEGFGRQGVQEKTQFYIIARGSNTELQDQLLTARDLDYLATDLCLELTELATTVNKLINGLIRSILNK